MASAADSTAGRPVTIAVAGAGIAGLAIAIALKDHPGVRVQLYERAAELREIGASIALGPNGMRTLERLGVDNALDDSIAFRNASGFPMVYRHYQTGEIVSTDPSQADRNIDRRHWTARFYRAHLQEALAAHVVDGDDAASAPKIHLGKTFEAVAWDAAAQNLVLTFADGTSATADLLVGADGLHSRVRTFFAPQSRPQWTGGVAFRSVFSRAHVAHLEGESSPLLPLLLPHEATHVWGPDRTLFFSPLGRDLYTVVGNMQLDPDEEEVGGNEGKRADYKNTAATWASEGSVDKLRSLYADWGPLAKSLVAAVPHTELYPNASSTSLPTWVLSSDTVPAGRVTLAGDAAHAHGGAFATGGSLALDDAWAFAAALQHVFPPSATNNPGGADFLFALRLYEQTRKAHTDRLLHVVHAANAARVERVRTLQQRTTPADGKGSAGPDAPETDEQLRARIRARSDPTWLHEHDVQAVFATAVREIEKGNAPESHL